jgi:hypothetical protein
MRLRSTASEHADVHIVSSEPLDAVHAWADRRGFDQAAFLHLDAERITGVLATRSIPVTWIISGDGRLVQRIHGAHAWDDPSVVAFLASLSVDPTERVSSSVAQGP